MARKLTVVVSQGQSAQPAKRRLEEDLIAGLLMERGIEVNVVPHLYDLAPDGTGVLCLQGLSGPLVVVSWLYPRAAQWVLNRFGVLGQTGNTLLDYPAEADDDDADDLPADAPVAETSSAGAAAAPSRLIYCLDFRMRPSAAEFIAEIRRIAAEVSTPVVPLSGLMQWIQGAPQPAQVQRYLNPTRSSEQPAAPDLAAAEPVMIESAAPTEETPGAIVQRIEEETNRRWYPVIDYTRCTNCLECLDFCLFGVYGMNAAEQILVEQPDNCRKGCPACSRVCPANAIIFPQHKSPAIAGSADGAAGGLKIDLSKLFGQPDALEVAVLERDVELVRAGRGAVGETVGLPQRKSGPRDELDDLIDQLDQAAL